MQDDVNLNYSELLQGRVISETKNLTISKNESSMIAEALSGNIFFKDKEIKNLSILDRNLYTDSFTFIVDNKPYLLKFGDQFDQFVFAKESKFLKKLQGENIAPQLITQGSSEYSSFLVTTFEDLPSIKQLSRLFLFENIEKFGAFLSKVHKKTRRKTSDKNALLQYYYTLSNFESSLEKDIYESLLSNSMFKSCCNMSSYIIDCCQQQITTFEESNVSLCHTNLTTSNILFDGLEEFRLINFDKGVYVNSLWDLAMFSIKTGMHELPKVEQKFLKAYNEKDYDIINNTLPAYKDVCFKLVLLELISTYMNKIIYLKNNLYVSFLFETYETIRPMINLEFPLYIKILDDMFGNFHNTKNENLL